MYHEKMNAGAVEQNLRDAGCTEEFIAAFMCTWEAGTPEEQLRLLAPQRYRLLNCVHEEQKKLDCLDYLRYQLQNVKKR